ncbi:NCS2 family permease [Kribbella kalugense]|uniref:AGZA family xanthine/uracil permease-like MFS transporter n=1 Tax=Kribbella kalugense TaxID=2512221 RepID=A0A4R7ZF72_9ACTN|nr:NCS2 family permease [Kribbella kalugense]TDW15932.1 AGZA family xanthine/uracil permease-like MFS transporter [Kribbella kalugense]
MSSPQAATARSGSGFLDSFFKISQRGSTLGREVRGGLVTFFTMAYIVVLNPLIIGTVKDGDGSLIGGGTDPGVSIAKVAVTTALVAGVVTILMGVFANFPLALATGLGLNAFIAFSVASDMTWADAMGLVVLEGLIILILVLTGFRKAVFEAVPLQLKVAISVGIGLFIAFIGVIDAGFVRRPAAPTGPPVELGVGGSLRGWPVLVFVLGLILIAILYARKVKGAILIGILAATVLAIVIEAIGNIGARTADNPGGWGLSVPKLPDQWFTKPNLDLIGEFHLFGAFDRVGVVTALLLIFTLMLADFFDTMGTMTAIGAEAGLNDKDGIPPNSQRILIVDSVAAAAGGAASVSSNTSYIESASGVGEGARTGLASIVTGICFLISMVVAPLVTLVPYEAATPALILVGFLMMTQVKDIDFKDIEVAFPAFLTIILMPFTYSISAGIGAGFVAYVILKVARGKARQIHPLMWVVAALFVVYFAIGPLTDWLT